MLVQDALTRIIAVFSLIVFGSNIDYLVYLKCMFTHFKYSACKLKSVEKRYWKLYEVRKNKNNNPILNSTPVKLLNKQITLLVLSINMEN